MSVSDYAEDLLLQWLLSNASATRPTSWYLALFTTATSDDGSGTEVGSGVGYSRQAITFGTAASGSITNNGSTITFGPNTTTNWGTVTHAAIFDASTAGNMLVHGALSASKSVTVGDSVQFAAGSVVMTMA